MEDQYGNEPDVQASAAPKELELVRNTAPSRLYIITAKRPIFPGINLPLHFDTKRDRKAIKLALEEDHGFIGCVYGGQREPGEDTPRDLPYSTGTTLKIFKVKPVNDFTIQVVVGTVGRFKMKKEISVEPLRRWEVEHVYEDRVTPDNELRAYMMAIISDVRELLKLNPMFQEQVNLIVAELDQGNPSHTLDLIANVTGSDPEVLQELLETEDVLERAKLMLELLREESQIARIQQKIKTQVDETVSKQQREYFLNEQLKAIKKELGLEKDEVDAELEKIEKRLSKLKLPAEARKAVDEEINKLKLLNPQSPEYNVTRSYLELISLLPWGLTTKDNKDIKKAREILDRDHYGLKDVKNNILEFLSSVIRKGTVAGSIICLVGPPGVGKTSIGKSIAEALNRKFFRFSVGGMRDEAEIKGHRRTYIGAMPGKIIQALKRVESSNPVIMLDEVDKIGFSFTGDPASALLEVLDPEQNHAFLDHYLDIPFDLSKILFISTANHLDTVPQPLLDRMEIIRLSGYIQDEKVEIAKRYLIPRQLQEQGFKPDEVKFTDDALHYIVDNYAREAGVRYLDMLLRKIVRKINLSTMEGSKAPDKVDTGDLEEYLGKPRFKPENLYTKDQPGVALGLAYTMLGGTTLYIEATGVKTGKEGFQYTGQLGDVMKESARIAYTVVRSMLGEKDQTYFNTHHMHLHVPAGATPKDGPSAGITMALALYSLATGKPIRNDLAMTGELTLTGKILPIGGIQEKIIAARRVKVMEVVLPEENRSDYEELQDHLKEDLTIHFVDHFNDLLKVAFREKAGKK